MKSLTTPKSFKIDHNQNIGTVVLVVEGQVDEFKLLDHIFHKVLHYELVLRPRGKAEFKIRSEYVSKRHSNSRVIIVNASSSNIKSTLDSGDYINQLYKDLLTVYGIDIKNRAVFYIWDRDRESNLSNHTADALEVLSDPYGDHNGDSYENGLLLLSYPKLESYVISNFEGTDVAKGVDLKKYVKSRRIKVSDITEDTLLQALCDMHKKFIGLGIRDYNLDNFVDANVRVYNYQENFYNNNQTYRLLSLLSIIFLYLGIIKPR